MHTHKSSGTGEHLLHARQGRTVKALEDQMTEAGITDDGFQAELRSRSEKINGRHSVSIC